MTRLKDIMSSPVEVIGPEASAAEARDRMRKGRIHHLVVKRGREVVGILSERDLDGAAADANVETTMSTDVVTAAPGTTVRDAAKLLRGRAIGCLPVLDRGRAVGMVTITDLLELLGKGALRIQPETVRWILWRRGPRRRPAAASGPRPM
jgi:CBS domain-containing protein